MKVFILTEGGKSIGFGHVARCLSLCQALEERGIKPTFIIKGDRSVCSLLKKRKVYIFNWLSEKRNLFKKIKQAQIAIIDSYLASAKHCKFISNAVDISLYIDDNNRVNYPAGLVVNGSLYARKLHYPKKRYITYLLGTKYTLLNTTFRDIPKRTRIKKIKNVLITFGGDDRTEMIPKILEFLNVEYPKINKTVVIGKGFSGTNVKNIEKLKSSRVHLICNPDSAVMKENMLKSDIAISAAGQTIHELARLGIPTLGICAAKNQLKNAEAWSSEGFLEYAGWHKDKLLISKIKRSIENLQSKEIRKKKTDLARCLIDGNGNQRVIKAVLSHWFRNAIFLRKARLSDTRPIFQLFNDDLTRQNSFNPKRISWLHHVRWMRKSIEDSDCVIFIVCALHKFYGQVRFNINNAKNEATVSFSLTKDIRGLNLSSFILNKAVTKIMGESRNIKKIKAYIRQENMISIKSFTGAKFYFEKNLKIRHYKTKLYVRKIKNV